ncbi:MAG: alpha/beta fold hydrolase [Chlorobium sp.]|jgi:carboxylesterase|nr:alpha/beta fold hydrolase [Chlorobium sp.]
MIDKLLHTVQQWWRLLLMAAIVPAAIFFILKPWNIPKLLSRSRPAENHDEALRRAEALKSAQKKEMNPLCLLQVMTHRKKTDRAVILVHGYTSCPRQFYELGRRFYDLGDNVLIAPLPHHGLADRLTDDQGQLKAEELAAYADEVVDIACGLGDRVVMMGISAGGVTTAWAAQNRRDIDLAVIVSPAFGFGQIPVPLTAAAMNIYAMLPDSYSWWNVELQENLHPDYIYPRYSMHALTEILRLGFVVQEEAMHASPAAEKIVMVFNANDTSINNDRTREILDIWNTGHINIETFEFQASLKLGHDLIDPNQPDQNIALVYPEMIRLCELPRQGKP